MSHKPIQSKMTVSITHLMTYFQQSVDWDPVSRASVKTSSMIRRLFSLLLKFAAAAEDPVPPLPEAAAAEEAEKLVS